MTRLKQIITIILFSTAVLGCRMCSPGSSGNSDETVFEATDVGTPTGEPVTLSIGAEGGLLTSADSRLVLAVPENAVKEPVTFSIQPITNTDADGIGSAYRLGPSGYKFDKPLLVSFAYDDSDMKGSAPDTWVVAFQDDSRAWRSLETAYIDEQDKLFTALTTHFSDMRFTRRSNVGFKNLDRVYPEPKPVEIPYLKQFRLTPEKATIYIGESVQIQLIGCEKVGLGKRISDWVWSVEGERCGYGNGAGYIDGPTYWIKPTRGHLTVTYGTETTVYKSHLHDRPGVVKVFAGGAFPEPGEPQWKRLNGVFGFTEITILDRGYRVSGQDGPVSYSGIVCDLEKPFSIGTAMGPVSFATNFTPAKWDRGTASWTASYGAMGSGTGPYWLEEQKDGFQIIVNLNSKVRLASRQSTGTGVAHITLTRLTSDECRGEKKK